ncbi:MAG: hypothetical protein K1X88_09765 [Nannocystaceae bacterium]|nr:hypothetical protein [Nannocystaceae bacterium]
MAEPANPGARPTPAAPKLRERVLWMYGLPAGAGLMLLFLRIAAKARIDGATISLVLTAFALVLCLYSLYRLVQAVSRPSLDTALEVEAELGVASDRDLREEKRRLLRAINELRFDHEMGKLSQADYDAVREAYTLQAVEVMRLLEGERGLHPELAKQLGLAVDPVAVTKADEPAADEPAAAETSAAADAGVAAASEPEAAASEPPAAASEPEAAASEPPAAASEPPAAASEPAAKASEPVAAASTPAASRRVCASCDGDNDGDAKFCKHCGKELAA